VAARYATNREVCVAVGQVFEDRLGSTDTGAVAILLRGYARLLLEGYPAGTELIVEALRMIAGQAPSNEVEAEVAYLGNTIAASLWDHETQMAILKQLIDWTRETGTLALLPKLLVAWAGGQMESGEFRASVSTLDEAEAIAAVTGVVTNPDPWGFVHAWCDDERVALERIDQIERDGGTPFNTELARALLFNALGRYDLALSAAQRSCDLHQLGAWGLALVELVEAAVRTGDHARGAAAFEQLAKRTQQGGTDWALGIEARARALLDDAGAEDLYREALRRLAKTAIRPDLARAHLLYGEWLRRANRRVDARSELLEAHEQFSAMGAAAFTDRARRELVATGEHVRARIDDTRVNLTAQEMQVARLASGGLTNAEIAAQMFLSPRTVEWHLRQVFGKLGIASRRELRGALSPA
jgi:DNA-binding CsgD family transcriptional regulator/tetratricopeptide (TPR) repeat protein